jgi:hypothetical protein
LKKDNNMKTIKRNKKPQYECAPTIKNPVAPPTPEAIRLRAHQIFLSRGGIPGRELEDWLLAEQELKQRSREFKPSTT